MKYRSVVFHATDESGLPIYHTNVMMCVADRYVVICLDCIQDTDEKKLVEETILSSGKEIICISQSQMNQFAGNMLQLENENLLQYNRVVHASLQNIESNGGGSARCMIAEIHL